MSRFALNYFAGAFARALLIIVALCLLAALLGGLAAHAYAGGLAPIVQPVPRDVDICATPYALAPGEQLVRR